MPGFECKLLSSLIKVFPDSAPDAPMFANASALRVADAADRNGDG